jgi:hypothetical protein
MEGIYFSGANPEGSEAYTEGPVNLSNSVVEGPGNRGRPNSLSEEQLEQLLGIYYSRPYSLRQIADMFGVSRMTVWRAVHTAQIQLARSTTHA